MSLPQVQLEKGVRENLNVALKALGPQLRLAREGGRGLKEIYGILGKYGLAGLSIPGEYGGCGFSRLTVSRVFDTIAQASVGLAVSLAAHNLCADLIKRFGTPEQKKRWLPPMARGDFIGAFALSEPRAGSDLASIEATVRPANAAGAAFIIDGKKVYVTNGGAADLYAVLVQESPEGDERVNKDGRRGKTMTVVVVEAGSNGLRHGRSEEEYFFPGFPTSALFMDRCTVPAGAVLGERGRGYAQVLNVLDTGRISFAAISVGLARRILAVALDHVRHRHQFGAPLADFQSIRFTLADLATELEASSLLVEKAAMLADEGAPVKLHASMAKKLAGDLAARIAVEGTQIFGAVGALRYAAKQMLWEAKMTQLLEGSTQVQQMIIARELLDV